MAHCTSVAPSIRIERTRIDESCALRVDSPAVNWLSLAAGVLGGVGLFLLGMRLLTNGLRLAAGSALQHVLQRWTATRLRAVLSGVLITSLVQSSSAVTVAVIGFVNAGLLSLAQAIAVIYGTNVGTTTTAWLVASLGFHVNVKAFALPVIGIGMALTIAREGRRLGALGEALAGFGLFFLGIDVLKSALEGLEPWLDLDALAVTGPGAVLAFTAVGSLLTVLMQSSSAALALILTSVGGGMIPIDAGACLVIGANLGTTSTAGLAVIGATPNAKRVAVAHLAFNAITASVALLALPLLLVVLSRFRQALGLDSAPAAVLASFHTMFNVLGVVLLWPVTNRLVGFVAARFRTPEEEEARPRYLDRNVLSTPVLAIRALGMELARIGRIARETAVSSLRDGRPPDWIDARRRVLDELVTASGEFVAGLQRSRLPREVEPALPMALRIARYDLEIGELARTNAASRARLDPLPPDLERQVTDFERSVLQAIDAAAVDLPGTTAEHAASSLEQVQRSYAELKADLLRAGAEGRVPVRALVDHLDRLSDVRRLAEQVERGARYLWALGALVEGSTPNRVDGSVEASDPL